jgi:carboxyl-terminal processing protease
MLRPVNSSSPRIAAFAAGAAISFAQLAGAALLPGTGTGGNVGPGSAPAAPAAPAAPSAPPKVPDATPPNDIEHWSEELWDAARTSNRPKVDLLLDNVPDAPAATSFRGAVVRREQHVAETRKKVLEEREAKGKEMAQAVSEGNATKALVDAAYLKFLADDWKSDLSSAPIKATIALADKTIADAKASGDWLYAEELCNRVRALYEGSTLKAEYQKYDDMIETDLTQRVMLVLEYAPRAWYDLRKKQYDRLDAKDRKEPFAPFNEKSVNDWKQSIEGINDRILSDALTQIAAQHLENIGWKPLIEGGLSMEHLLATTPALGENFKSLGDQTLAGAFAKAISEQQASVAAMKAEDVDARTYAKVFEALRAANKATVKLPDEVLVREFGNGAIATITHEFEDPYTEIVWPDRMRRFNQMIKGNFVGVGILIRHNEKREIVIVNPLDGSPAKRAGVKPGDKIVSVNGASTADWPLDKAVDTITGPAGTKVALGVAREGEAKPMDMGLVREKIKMYSVQGWRKKGYNARSEPQWEWFINPEGGIGYIRLSSFNEDTFTDFLKAMREMSMQHPINGLVLDLRGNPGGLLQSAVSFVNAFVRQGRIVSVEDRNGQELYAFTAQRQRAPLADVPTVVLINEGSASASEIVSGALEAHDAAVVLGERSFGKGSVQEVHELGGKGGDPEATVKYTVQHYLLPPKPGQAKGRLVHKKPGSDDWGVMPDYVVKLAPAQIEEINKIRASADDIPEDAQDGAIETPGSAKSTGSEPPSEGKPVDAKKKEPRDPAELIEKGYDAQLEMAVLILEGRALGMADKPAAPPEPAQRPAAPAAGGKHS